MPETNLERYNARQAKRDELIAEILKEARKQAAQAIKSLACRTDQHERCNGRGVLAGDKPADNECLCTCHDPETTYWVEWSPAGELLEAGSMCSGPYGTVDEAIDDGFSAKPAEARWIREQITHGRRAIEQVDSERYDALMGWESKTASEKAALQPRSESGI